MDLFGDNIQKYKNDIIYHLREVIRIRSKRGAPAGGMPYGPGVDAALRYMLRLGEMLGFETKNIEGYAGHAEYGRGEKIIAVLVHLDVVPEGSGWTYPPFGAEIAEGRIYGRGAADNKGPAVAALYSLKALRDSGMIPDRRIRVIFGTNEENGMDDIAYYFTKEHRPVMSFAPDAGYPIFNREKGIVRLKITGSCDPLSPVLSISGGIAVNVVPDFCEARIDASGYTAEKIDALKLLAERQPSGCSVSMRHGEGCIIIASGGRQAHASDPSSGLNAITHLISLLFSAEILSNKERLLRFVNDGISLETDGSLLGISCRDDDSGELTVNLGIFTSDGSSESAELDIRYPVTASGAMLLEKIRSRLDEYGLTAAEQNDSPPLHIKEGHPLLRILGSAYEKVTSKKAGLLTLSGGTYARMLRNRCVAFGSADGCNVHQPDEYVTIAGLMEHARICTQALYELAVADLAETGGI